jgi:60S ribosomal protein uL30
MAESVKLQKVPETLLKKRKRLDEIRARSVAGEIHAKKTPRSGVSRIPFKRAEKLIKEFRVKERYETNLARQAKKPASCKAVLPAEPRLVFAIRMRSVNGLHAQPRRVLKMLRLTKVNSGTFLKLNKTTFDLLQLVEPYVTWGYPTLQNVRDLLYKRGHAKVNKKHLALTDNALIEQALGEFGIVCMEDLVHEIVSLGEHFKDVTALLWHFKLNAPASGWKKNSLPFTRGGDCGARDDKISYLLKRMI